MNGRRYYITTLADWQRHAARFTNSHWLALAVSENATVPLGVPPDVSVGARHALPERPDITAASSSRELPAVGCGFEPAADGHAVARAIAVSAATPILVLIEADEGVHLALEDDAAFEPLPHPLTPKPISVAAQSALASHGVPPGATTFDATEAVARAHPLLRHRVF
ncbi:MAG: hypothetical protein ACRD59_12460 [Candidatus Acidiferrales bacterium]